MADIASPDIINVAATVATLVVLEGVLSTDNALVLAIMVRHLPKDQQGKALRYGILGAFGFRAIGVILASWLIRIWYVKAIGAAYLLYLCGAHFWQHFTQNNELAQYELKTRRFWPTVVRVELMDIAFSVDSIVAAVALSSQLWVVILGGVLGIIAMRFVAQTFIKLLEKFSGLETSAYVLVGWIGFKLLLETYHQQADPEAYEAALKAHQHFGGMPAWLFWGVMAIVFVAGFLIKGKKPPQVPGLTTQSSDEPPSAS